jgi:hypothetical protein
MQQTYEYYVVDPLTWRDKKKIENVTSSSIERSSEDETLGSASIECLDDLTDLYVRQYLVTVQDGIKERFALGTHLYQSPSTSFDGMTKKSNQQGYTSLIELKDDVPPVGFSVLAGQNIMDLASKKVAEIARAPVIPTTSSLTMTAPFVAETSDTWLTYLTDLIAVSDYIFREEPTGEIGFSPVQELNKMAPIWEFNDDNSSILYPDITVERDLYGVPNVVEVIFSPSEGTPMYASAINDDPASITSTIKRGRKIVYRDTNPSIPQGATQEQLNEYAAKTLSQMSEIQYSISFSHGYCPVRLGDCVRLNYTRAGLNGVNAKIVSQSIKCEPGCKVDTKAIFTKKLWR